MARIFNILVSHKGHSYPALLTVSGDKKDQTDVRVISGEEKIEIVMENGSLSFFTSEVLARLKKADFPASESPEMHITSGISLRLLNSDW